MSGSGPRQDGCTCGQLAPEHLAGCPVVPFVAPTIPAHETTLDEAWAAAEKALPEGWRISTLMIEWDDKGWVVEAEPLDPNGPPVVQGTGPTPAAALHALAAALGRSGSGGGRG